VGSVLWKVAVGLFFYPDISVFLISVITRMIHNTPSIIHVSPTVYDLNN
jgi:hypothetical protein